MLYNFPLCVQLRWWFPLNYYFHLLFCNCELSVGMIGRRYGRSRIELLPFDVYYECTNYLSMKDIVRLSEVNKDFNKVFNMDSIWTRIYNRDLGYPCIELKPKNMTAKRYYKRVYCPTVVLWRFVFILLNYTLYLSPSQYVM